MSIQNSLDIYDARCIFSLNVGVPFSISDHNKLLVNIVLPIIRIAPYVVNSNPNENIWDWSNVDLDAFYQHCSLIDWNIIFIDCNCSNDYWYGFYSCFNSCIELFVSTRTKHVTAIKNKYLNYLI